MAVLLHPYWRPSGALLVPIDANRAGYLKAVWLDLLGCLFEVWPAPGAREGLQKCGPTSLKTPAAPLIQNRVQFVIAATSD